MKILHLTDLHYSKTNKLLIDRLKPQLIKSIKENNNINNVDLIVFTGDLVYSGNDNEFEIAKKEFVDYLCKELNVSKDNFIFCAGNHDLETNKEFKSIKGYIDGIKNNDELDSFSKQKDEEFENSCLNSKSYNDFVKNYYDSNTSFHFDPLYQTFINKIDQHSVGVVSFNTAWRSFIGKDSGSLLIPRQAILEAHDRIKDCKIKICLMHHDLSELRNYNVYEIEDYIYEMFHLKFAGHYHKKRQGTIITPDIGMLTVFSPSTMSGNDGSKIGYSVLDIDLDTLEGFIYNYDYNRSENLFTHISTVPANIPVNSDKTQQIELLKAVKEAYEEELNEANDLLVCENDKSIEKNFLDLFSSPLLKKASKAELLKTKRDSKNILVESLLENNHIIYGKDKSGKTSLLRKLELELLSDFKFKSVLPIFFDFKNIKVADEQIDLKRHLKSLLRLSNKKIESIIGNSTFSVLIDNFDPDKQSHIKRLESLILKIKTNGIVLACSETLTSSIEDPKLSFEISKLYLHSLTRTEIRTHTKKWLDSDNEQEQQEVIKKIETIFTQMNISFNYWSVSLFLWLYKKEKNTNINNNVELVNLYVDGLLDRNLLANSASNIDYDTFRSFLGELAYNLLTEYIKNDYCISYSELVIFIEEYREKNILFVAQTEELLEFLIEKGILKKTNSSSQYTFRLNGVMEFFVAFYMSENPEFIDDILKDEFLFLEFANEFELYAGFVKNDLDFLKKIRDKVTTVLSVVNREFEGQRADNILVSKIKNASEMSHLATNIKVDDQLPLAYTDQDSMMDEIKPLDNFDEEVRVKKAGKNIEDYSYTEFEKHIFILCRVFRGLSLIKDKAELNKTLDFILDSMINLGYKLLEEISLELDKSDEEKEKHIIDLLSNFIPIIVQMSLSEAILQKTLKRLIESKIDELNNSKDSNEYKLFILYYMLLDIDLEHYSRNIDEIISKFKLFTLKNASLFKLFYLLMFKANGSNKLQNLLKEGIIQQQVSIKPEIDKSQFKQQIEKQVSISKHINNETPTRDHK